ncbi:hypothetical protein NHP190002_11320 [Helicobacter ailurogastricus]|uniref:hypothetical protein n=1 Tax=Helicobacter ailurogastricus TaxID=1578720 RepID=UPI00244D8A75|nr:hypothetical protein [Helicobacter ailurogastricus]GMB90439.1 hypothetical protein NHP190002_11320 [Helicobacter ailurogastricus]
MEQLIGELEEEARALFIQFPTSLEQSPDYTILKAFLKAFGIDPVTGKFALINPQALSTQEDYFNNLTQADTERADIKAYDPKILTDANRGLWELWEDQGAQEGVFVPFKTPAVARNPKADIKNGWWGLTLARLARW